MRTCLAPLAVEVCLPQADALAGDVGHLLPGALLVRPLLHLHTNRIRIRFLLLCVRVCDIEREPPHQDTRNCPRQPKIPAANQHHPLPIPLPRNDKERHLARRTRRLRLIGPKRGVPSVGRIGLEEEADTP
jgi:hypothetical protein